MAANIIGRSPESYCKPCKDGKKYYTDAAGRVWRVYNFVNDAFAYNTIENPDVFRKAGKAFGEFQNQLADFPIDTLYETIPPLLIEIQPTLARENKWLERRTRVRQALQQINGCYKAPGKIRSSRIHEVEEEIDKITMVALVDAEKVALDETVMTIRRYRRRRSLLFAVIISLIIILGAVYYYLPWIAEKLGIG